MSETRFLLDWYAIRWLSFIPPIFNQNIEKYLTAIYELSKSFNKVPSTALSYHLGVTYSAISDFFKKKSVINKYVDFTVGKGRTPTKYLLTEEGKNIVSLIFHFRDYYESLGLSNSNRERGPT